ncbi:MAG: hypothetical protein ACQESG_06675 [Nanobdellota archaeon]
MERHELFERIREHRPEMNDEEIIQFSLEKTLDLLEGQTEELNTILARLEQLETRQLEQDFVTKKILDRIQEIRT